MSKQAIEILTPTGRMVGGDAFTGKTTNRKGEPLIIKNGPNAGQPRTEYYIGLAIPKTDPGWADLWSKINQAAKAGYPHLFNADGSCNQPSFAWKVIDGDSTVMNKNQKRPCDKEGYPGHYVLSFSSGYPFPCYARGGESLLTDPQSIKPGYYIRIAGNVVDNDPSDTPGVYLNIAGVELIGYGQEIQRGGIDGKAVFGGSPVAQLPAGASETPIAPATTGAGMVPGGAPAAPGPAGTPAPDPAAPATSGANVAPAPGFMSAPGAPPPPTPDESGYIHAGVSYTREALKASNWTDEQIDKLPRG